MHDVTYYTLTEILNHLFTFIDICWKPLMAVLFYKLIKKYLDIKKMRMK